MATGVISWSQTASSNATADSAVNWAEGMSPNAVNDSARATLASVAKWRDDISGSITTGGTSTAYTATSNQGYALTAGTSIAFTPHTTCGATVTINVDSLGAKPLRSSPGVELAAGTIIQGTPYVAMYATSNSGEWILRDFYGNPYQIPIGGFMPYLSTTAPNSAFVLPYGQAISRTTYATLFAMVSTTFGTGDGSTTFNIPDLRGRAIFGLDNMGGSAASRVTTAGASIDGTTLGASGGAQNVTISQANLPAVTLATSIAAGQGAHTHTIAYNLNVSQNFGTGPSNQATSSGSTTTSSATLPAMTGTTPLGGSGTATVVMPPSMVLPYILRVI